MPLDTNQASKLVSVVRVCVEATECNLLVRILQMVDGIQKLKTLGFHSGAVRIVTIVLTGIGRDTSMDDLELENETE